MDIFFHDPSEVPLPPDEVRIRRFQAKPWPDGRRVRIYLEITPFQRSPNGEIVILDARGDEVASASIIETIDPQMEFTLHLRGAELAGHYKALVTVFFTAAIPLPEAGDQSAEPVTLPEPVVVDRAETEFDL